MWKNCFCFTKFLIQFGEKRGHWTPDFWYRMWDCQPMVSRILNSKNVYWISASFVANQKKIVSLVVVFFVRSIWNLENGNSWNYAVSRSFYLFKALLHDFLFAFADGKKKDLWILDFWYRMWDYPPLFSRILNFVNWILDSFLANQKNSFCFIFVSHFFKTT